MRLELSTASRLFAEKGTRCLVATKERRNAHPVGCCLSGSALGPRSRGRPPSSLVSGCRPMPRASSTASSGRVRACLDPCVASMSSASADADERSSMAVSVLNAMNSAGSRASLMPIARVRTATASFHCSATNSIAATTWRGHAVRCAIRHHHQAKVIQIT